MEAPKWRRACAMAARSANACAQSERARKTTISAAPKLALAQHLAERAIDCHAPAASAAQSN